MRPTDITIKNVSFSTEDFSYRTLIKFGGVAVDRVTMLNAEVEVETSQGKRSVGKGEPSRRSPKFRRTAGCLQRNAAQGNGLLRESPTRPEAVVEPEGILRGGRSQAP